MRDFECAEIWLAPHADTGDSLVALEILEERLTQTVLNTGGRTVFVMENNIGIPNVMDSVSAMISRGFRPIIAEGHLGEHLDQRGLADYMQRIAPFNSMEQPDLLDELDRRGVERPGGLELVLDRVYQDTVDADGRPRLDIIYEAHDLDLETREDRLSLEANPEAMQGFLNLVLAGEFETAADIALLFNEALAQNTIAREQALAERVASHGLVDGASALIVNLGDGHRTFQKALRQQGVEARNVHLLRDEGKRSYYFEPFGAPTIKMVRKGIESINQLDRYRLAVVGAISVVLQQLDAEMIEDHSRQTYFAFVWDATMSIGGIEELRALELRSKQEGAIDPLLEIIDRQIKKRIG